MNIKVMAAMFEAMGLTCYGNRDWTEFTVCSGKLENILLDENPPIEFTGSLVEIIQEYPFLTDNSLKIIHH